MGNATARIETVQEQDWMALASGLEPAWVSYKEAGRYSGLSRTTLWTLVGAGEIRVAKIGSAVRIERASLEDFMRRSAT